MLKVYANRYDIYIEIAGRKTSIEKILKEIDKRRMRCGVPTRETSFLLSKILEKINKDDELKKAMEKILKRNKETPLYASCKIEAFIYRRLKHVKERYPFFFNADRVCYIQLPWKIDSPADIFYDSTANALVFKFHDKGKYKPETYKTLTKYHINDKSKIINIQVAYSDYFLWKKDDVLVVHLNKILV